MSGADGSSLRGRRRAQADVVLGGGDGAKLAVVCHADQRGRALHSQGAVATGTVLMSELPVAHARVPGTDAATTACGWCLCPVRLLTLSFLLVLGVTLGPCVRRCSSDHCATSSSTWV
jgi:hypothetical protein